MYLDVERAGYVRMVGADQDYDVHSPDRESPQNSEPVENRNLKIEDRVHDTMANTIPPTAGRYLDAALFFLVSSCLLHVSDARPNIIIMQPDDFEFIADWTPPAHFPTRSGFPMVPLPNIERLRNNGVVMDRAYTSSPVCATSRYSTISGRHPSRSSYTRDRSSGSDVSLITIPSTKLLDLSGLADGNDCSESNLAVLFQENGYRTGFMGKWHLSPNNRNANYDDQRSSVQSCGFDTAEAIYWGNFDSSGRDGYLHNLEHLTGEALQFIDSAVSSGNEFFLYFNPTAPHSQGNVFNSLTEFTCRHTPEGLLDTEPVIPGMTAGIGCEAYRQTVLDRANGDTSNPVLGGIWVDDTVGALMQKLESVGQLNNTLFLFQIDHGQQGKGSLFEPGIRIAQFVHYPDKIPANSSFEGLVSTIDIGPTVADYAGINPSAPGWYTMDGSSWRPWLERDIVPDRCLVSELDQDRAVVCGCEKLLEIGNLQTSTTNGRFSRFRLNSGPGDFLLCDSNGDYITGPDQAPEVNNAPAGMVFDRTKALLDCHLDATKADSAPAYGACTDLEFASYDDLLAQTLLQPNPSTTDRVSETVSETEQRTDSDPSPTNMVAETVSETEQRTDSDPSPTNMVAETVDETEQRTDSDEASSSLSNSRSPLIAISGWLSILIVTLQLNLSW